MAPGAGLRRYGTRVDPILIDEGNTNPGKLAGMLMKDHKDELDGKLARDCVTYICG